MIWGGRSILFFLGMGKGKEKVKEIWNVPIITYHININAIKQSIFQKKPNYDVTITSHTSKNKFLNGIS